MHKVKNTCLDLEMLRRELMAGLVATGRSTTAELLSPKPARDNSEK
jgi:hypothetical protein